MPPMAGLVNSRGSVEFVIARKREGGVRGSVTPAIHAVTVMQLVLYSAVTYSDRAID